LVSIGATGEIADHHVYAQECKRFHLSQSERLGGWRLMQALRYQFGAARKLVSNSAQSTDHGFIIPRTKA